MATEDRVEGMQAFLEKRRPDLQGPLMPNVYQPRLRRARAIATGFRCAARASALQRRRRATRRERLRAAARARPTVPYHYHLANEELLVVLRGQPDLRTPEGWRRLEEGEVVAFPVGERGAHQLVNRTDEHVRVLIVSEMRDPEVAVYPDSGKIGAREHAPGSGREGCGSTSTRTTTGRLLGRRAAAGGPEVERPVGGGRRRRGHDGRRHRPGGLPGGLRDAICTTRSRGCARARHRADRSGLRKRAGSAAAGRREEATRRSRGCIRARSSTRSRPASS